MSFLQTGERKGSVLFRQGIIVCVRGSLLQREAVMFCLELLCIAETLGVNGA